MCFGTKPSDPAPPPPPAPPVNPIEIAPTESSVASTKRKRLGASLLQIPLTPTPTSGLGIPNKVA